MLVGMNPETLERLIARGRDSYESRLAAGQAWLRAGDARRAEAHLRRATEHQPGLSMAWQELGQACLQLDEREAARQAWQRGLEAAQANGDKQAEKVMAVFLRRLDR